MAVEVLSRVAPEIDSSVETTRTLAIPLPDGTDRLVLFEFMAIGEFGGDAGGTPFDTSAYTATLDGAAMTVQALVMSDGLDLTNAGVCAIAVDDAATGSVDAVLTLVGATGTIAVALRATVLGGALAEDAALNYQFSSDVTEGTPISLSATAPEDALIFSFATQYHAAELPFDAPSNFSAFEEDGVGDFALTVSGGRNPGGRDAYLIAEAETTAAVEWQTEGDALAAFMFVIRPAPENPSCEFNCDCELVSPYATLSTLRTEMMAGMGYAAQASNPPPGMLTLIDFLLRQAQEFLWLRYEQVRCERFFRWTMVPGLRYYGIDEGDPCCAGLTLDPLKITWVGFEDLNKTWVQLIEGIPPEFYTRAQTTTGWPSHYEIRQCLEIFPAPQAAYSLWVKGNFGLGPLASPTDRTTIDDRAVLWYALGLSGRGPFANTGKAMALQRIKDITAGQHNTARFVPRPGGPLQPMTPPRFLPLGDEPA